MENTFKIETSHDLKDKEFVRFQYNLILSCLDFPEMAEYYLEKIDPANDLEI